MNIKQLLKNYRKLLNPTLAQEERVYLKVFGEYPKKNNYFNIFNMKQNKFKNLFLAGFLIFTFISAPLVYMAYNNASGALNQSSLGPVPEDGNLSDFDSEKLLKELSDRAQFSQQKKPSQTPNPTSYDGKNVVADIKEISGGSIKPEDTATPEYLRAKNINAYLNLRNENIQRTFNDTKNIITELGGFIISSQYKGISVSGTEIIAKVPSDKFDMFMQKVRDLNVAIVQEDVKVADKQNELTTLLKTKNTYDENIKNIEDQISKEQDALKKSSLTYQLNTYKSSLANTNDQITKLDAQTLFATVEVDFTKPVFQLFSTNIDELLFSIKTVALFWLQVAIYLAVPVGLFLGYRYWRKRKIKN